MSNGVFHLLNRGMAPDFAIIMKPWNWVYHEEPGMGWFRITVKGTLGYAGVPRGLPDFRSSVVPAAAVITALEQWLIDYAEANTSGQIKPHGWIAGVRGGGPNVPLSRPPRPRSCATSASIPHLAGECQSPVRSLHRRFPRRPSRHRP
jgi:hypothetical protein